MSQKWRFDSKWQIKIRFFHITLRVSNIFSIFFLHSFGVTKTQILWKKSFQKIQDGGLNGFFYSSHHLGFFEKLVFHKICVLVTLNECKKKRLKKYWILSELCEKIWFWSAILNRTAIFDSFDKICSWFMLLTKIQTHRRKQNVKILENS
jgi:hypothetical protein